MIEGEKIGSNFFKCFLSDFKMFLEYRRREWNFIVPYKISRRVRFEDFFRLFPRDLYRYAPACLLHDELVLLLLSMINALL